MLALLYASCGKEPSFEQNDEPEPPIVDTPSVDTDTIPLAENGGLLKRFIMVYDGAKDSLIFTLKYDDKNRLLEILGLHEGPVGGTDNMYKYLEQYTWNSKGYVEKIKEISYFYSRENGTGDYEPVLHWDADCDIHYDEAKSQYTYAILTGVGESKPFKDSLVYRYNGDKIEQFLNFSFQESPEGYLLGDSVGYTYDNIGNIIEKTGTSRDYPDKRRPSIHTIIEYDNNLNPIDRGNEALLAGYDNFFQPTKNNLTKHTDLLRDENNFTGSYIYNSHKKPTIAKYKYDDGEEIIFRYFYLK